LPALLEDRGVTAYAYLRKSSVRDPAREVSHELQEDSVRRMAAERGDEPLTILSDWDKSGRLGADKRPGYRALLAAIESGQATSVYSYSLSRLGRSLSELARLIDDCTARGIPVRLYADHVDTSTASGRLLTNVLGSVAQFEADVASERVRAANAAKLARGETIATTPVYGDAEGEDGGAVLDAFREAGSFSGAAKLLNARGHKPRNSERGWWPSSVAVVVRRLDPKLPAFRSTRGAAAGGSDFALARLLRCPTCGTRLTGTRDRDGRRVRYSCRLGTSLPHPRVSVTEHLILPAIREEVARLRTPARLEAVAGGEAERAELEARRDRVIDLFEAGHIDRGDRERRLAAVQEDIERIDSRDVVLAIPDVDWAWPPRQLNNVLRALFDRIELDPATFQPTSLEWTVPEWRV
jgi:DNA invertase Pin-like site-specific DNA recombinase